MPTKRTAKATPASSTAKPTNVVTATATPSAGPAILLAKVEPIKAKDPERTIRSSFRQLQQTVSEYSDLPIDTEDKCEIGDRHVNRFAATLTNTLKFAAATPGNKISKARGQAIMQAFLRRKDTREFLQAGSNASIEQKKIQTALLIQENVVTMLKRLRGNSTKDACMLRNAIYACIVPDAAATGKEAKAEPKKPKGRPKAGTKSKLLTDQPVPADKKQIKMIVNMLAESYGLKVSTNPKQMVKAQVCKAYAMRCNFAQTFNVQPLVRYKRKTRSDSKALRRYEVVASVPGTVVATAPAKRRRRGKAVPATAAPATATATATAAPASTAPAMARAVATAVVKAPAKKRSR